MDTGAGTIFKAVGATTLTVAEPVIPLASAWIIAEPPCLAVTSPVLLTLAKLGCVELHAAIEDTSSAVPLVKVAIAWNWLIVPATMSNVAGTTLTEAMGTTVMLAVAVKPLVCALIVVEPICWAVTKPNLLTVAILAFFKLQVTIPLRSCVVASLKVAIASSCWLLPGEIKKDDGLMLKLTTTAGVTVRLVVPVTDPTVAMMLETPTDRPITWPSGVINATSGAEEFQIAAEVKSCVLPSE